MRAKTGFGSPGSRSVSTAGAESVATVLATSESGQFFFRPSRVLNSQHAGPPLYCSASASDDQAQAGSTSTCT